MAPLDSAEFVEARPRPAPPQTQLSSGLIWTFTVAVGVIIMNLSAPQPLIGPIAASLGMPAEAAGLISTLTLLGYGVGLIFLVPLADLLENRRLILGTQLCAVCAALMTAVITMPLLFLIALFLLGAACCSIQMLVPLAASMAPPDRRGRVVGDIMSGVMVGILLSRPAAGLVASAFGWRAFFVLSAALMAALMLALWRILPERRPHAGLTYPELIASLWTLLRQEPVLRLRSFTAACGLAAFTTFWTAISFQLSREPFLLDQGGIAVFSLVGVTAALVAPVAGRMGDRGWSFPATVLCHAMIAIGFAVAAWGGALSFALGLALLVLAAACLDIGVIGEQTIGRRSINLLNPEARGRLNALFVGLFFLGGSLGPSLAGHAWIGGGWPAVCGLGALFGFAALLANVAWGRR